MKKVMLVAVMLLAAGLLAVPAQVLALGGPHATFTCNNCHIPHAAGGDRLWISVKVGAGDWANNKIGQLCYTCHDGSQGGSNMVTYAFDAASHGPFYTAIPAGPDGAAGSATAGSAQLNDSGLPYTSATNPLTQGGIMVIQCTSCHFVHDETDGTRPYLRAGTGAAYRGDLCERCHLRGETDTAGEVGDNNDQAGAAPNAYARNISLHPVQITATGAGAGQGATLRANLIPSAGGLPNMGNAVPAAGSWTWALGGKLAAGGTTGTMDCNTCHAVHGDETALNPGQGDYILAIENYDAAGYNTSPLCYGCHQTPVVTTGAPGDDHPIDVNTGNYLVTYPNDGGPNHGSAISPWPAGNGANAEVVCSSCHDMHGGMPADASTVQGNNQNGRLRRFNEFATTDPTHPGATNWCYSCHANASPNNHHSHKGNLNVALEATDTMTSILDCEHCHGATGGTFAHNQTGGFFATRDFGSGNHAATALWCNYCHSVNPTNIQYPTDLAPATTVTDMDGQVHTGAGDVTPQGHGVDKGEGTHVLGWDNSFLFGANNTVVTIPMAAAWPAPAQNNLAGSIDGVADNVSRWASANVGDMACESCHNIIGNIGWDATLVDDDGGWMNNLLLMDYKDDGTGNRANAPGSSQTGSEFCMYCHYTAGSQGTTGPPGTHQITGQVITAATDNERTPDTLITGAGSYADAGTAPGQASYPNTDAMDCDSCHRVHDSVAGGTASATTVSYAAGTITKGVDFILEAAEAGAGIYSPALCTNCHNY